MSRVRMKIMGKERSFEIEREIDGYRNINLGIMEVPVSEAEFWLEQLGFKVLDKKIIE